MGRGQQPRIKILRAQIHAYGARRGGTIVRTYADEGKSGLNIDGRRSLQQLTEDVQKKETDFTTILVYDVSRWGRFPLPNNGLSAMPAVRATRALRWRQQRKAAGHGRHGHGIAAVGGFTLPAWRGS
jgi:DNA invertase Pin-like site-specific DNA recombinase